MTVRIRARKYISPMPGLLSNYLLLLLLCGRVNCIKSLLCRTSDKSLDFIIIIFFLSFWTIIPWFIFDFFDFVQLILTSGLLPDVKRRKNTCASKKR